MVNEGQQLVEWNKIKTEITLAKDIIVLGKLNYTLEAIQKWAKQSQQSLETQNEIAEYRLRLNRKQGEWIAANIPEEGDRGLIQEHLQATENSRLTLASAGIDRNDSPKYRILAKIPEEKFNAYLADAKEEAREITTNDACRLYTKNFSLNWTGDQENYTPEIYIEAARSVMGSIDLDPASSDKAQEVVKAIRYFTKETNGLKQQWDGNIFLNPPYSHPEVMQFIDKLLNELKTSQQAILLTNNNTDTNFFHKAAQRASAICFTKGRIRFYKDNTQNTTSPTNGQVFYYFGHNKDRFIQYFSTFGIIMVVYDS